MSASQSAIYVSKEELLKKAEELYKSGYDHVISISAVDYPERNEIELVVHVSSYTRKDISPKILEIRTKLDRSSPRVNSLTKVWRSAEFQEREAHEMFGIFFEGHSDLKYLLLDPEEFRFKYPLRKDFKVIVEDIMLKK
ncbi:NADH-quinone oxidoreductase subunit C [Fervidicoccus fontis]|uniref:Membrane-bound oxidoreductase, subunit MbxK n=2 Tax=Fervidicoccus fontis TaxID=683846 RepID=I0A2Y1_FERFK|nr:NADH-quinone oxidoreductase subunit C [Fervidicoccus fontis]AFH43338.1 Membrane-bound oxidoreductase, subunit MbxK [Fervidicoccus fontis Kam940]MBE9390714.1 NADH-quinone oxidoreductase subunit C [Fervidicoccus fontis]